MDPVLFVVFFAACVAAGATGGLFPTGAWYKTLNKPTWTPPNWVFPVAWTSIYLLISFAGARVGMMEGSAYALAFWALQIALNTLWTPVFFGRHMLKQSLPIMAGLWVAVFLALVAHWRVDWIAGLAFVPYLVWVTVAAALSLSLTRLNPDEKPLDLT